jgi:hypothetical protein
MKRTVIIILALTSFIISCSKNDNDAPLAAKGYWKGMMVYYEVAMLYRDNGTIAAYIQVPNGDTAAAMQGKFYGTYIENGNGSVAKFWSGSDSIFLVMTQVSPGLMKGHWSAKAQPGIRLPVEISR